MSRDAVRCRCHQMSMPTMTDAQPVTFGDGLGSDLSLGPEHASRGGQDTFSVLFIVLIYLFNVKSDKMTSMTSYFRVGKFSAQDECRRKMYQEPEQTRHTCHPVTLVGAEARADWFSVCVLRDRTKTRGDKSSIS